MKANTPELAKLVAEHTALKERLRELTKHVTLTSAEQLEVAKLKKRKLRAKDRIRLLERSIEQPRIQP